MADSTIPNLDLVTTPAGTDEFSVRQSGDTRDKKQTRTQLHSLQSGEHLVLPQVSEVATPTLAFGDGDSGIFESGDDTLVISIAGVARFEFSSNTLRSIETSGGAIINESATFTNPTLMPRRNDTGADTGIGSGGADQLNLIAGGLNCIGIAETAAAAQIGFYGTTPVSLQTGVAVTAAGVHAALVNLGLITA